MFITSEYLYIEASIINCFILLKNVFLTLTVAFNKIQHVYSVAIGRVIFDAWYNVTLDAKRTREYFEVIENI